MKILNGLKLSGAMLGLTVLLTACPGPTLPAATFDLTVALAGVSSAPVTVTNTTTNTELFKGTLDASKTFAGLTANDVLKIEGGNVSGYTTPAAQTVTLDVSKTVTLTYIKPIPAPTYDLTVNLSGVGSAPVTVTNTATNVEVFKGTLNASKTFTGLPANSVLKVEGGVVADFATPLAQTVTLDASKSVSLSYAALEGTALDAARVRGTIPGWIAGEGRIAFQLSNSRTTVDGNPADISAGGILNAVLPVPTTLSTFLQGCTFSARTIGNAFQAEFARPIALNPAGSLLGIITETTVTGTPILRMYSQTATTLKGTANCGMYDQVEIDIKVNVGWNVLSIVETNKGGKYTTVLRNLPSDARIQLGFIPEKPAVNLSTTDYSQIVLRTGTPVTREITITPTGAVSGSLDLSTSIPGVKVTPAMINLSGANSLSAQSVSGLRLIQQAVKPQALTTRVTFSLTDQAENYSGPLDLIASQGGNELGRTSFYTDVRVPSVSVNVTSYSVSAYQGGTTNVALSVSSQEGFSGNVTLNLTDLPVGVTASPVTVAVSANAITSVNVPLQFAADAPLGTATVKITGTKVSNQYGSGGFTLNIKPSRVSLGNLSSSNLTPASSGVWVIGGSSYSAGANQITLRRIAGGLGVKEVTLNDISTSLIPIPGGDIYAVGSEYSNSNTIYRIKDDGTFSTLSATSTVGMSNGVVDAQGRIWFISSFTDTSGAYGYGLFQWNPTTGTRTLIDSGQTYSYSNSIVVSNNGQYVLYRPTYSSGLILIDTATAAKSAVANPSGGGTESGAVSNTGQVWYSSYGSLTRANSDGTTTTFIVSGGSSRIIGFDQNNTNTLWVAGYGSLFKVDATSGAMVQTPTDSISSTALSSSGGVSFMTTGNYTGNGYEYFLSVLP